MSNVLGTTVDIKSLTSIAKKHNIKVLIDACQSAAHQITDVKQLGCDFFVCSGHKIYGPSGVGIVYIQKDLFDAITPYQTGGSVITNVSFDKTDFQKPPLLLEAGTPLIANVIAFGATLDYLEESSWFRSFSYQKDLAKTISDEINNLDHYNLLCDNDSPIISFNHKTAHHSDIGTLLNQYNIAVRTGHLCAQPLMHELGIDGAVRVSLGVYNDMSDVKKLINALHKISAML